MTRVVTLSITKIVEVSDCCELWQLNEEQLKETFLNDWEDWDSVDIKLETYNKEKQDEA